MHHHTAQPAPAFTYTAKSQTGQLDTLMGTMLIALPVLLAIGFLAHQKQRSCALRRQVARLEKLWLLDVTDSLY